MRYNFRTLMLLAGCFLTLTTIIAFLFAATLFSWPTQLPPLWDRVGFGCLFLWWLPGLVGGICFALAVAVR
jgi:hypothetical protein